MKWMGEVSRACYAVGRDHEADDLVATSLMLESSSSR
jgi:hypothetical protein